MTGFLVFGCITVAILIVVLLVVTLRLVELGADLEGHAAALKEHYRAAGLPVPADFPAAGTGPGPVPAKAVAAK